MSDQRKPLHKGSRMVPDMVEVEVITYFDAQTQDMIDAMDDLIEQSQELRLYEPNESQNKMR
jgi:hypothetical protein